jgi:flagellar M-ring protein FliF
LSNFVDTMKQLGPSRLGVMGAILVGLLLFFVFVSLRVSTPDMKVLYSDLSTADSSAMASKLQSGSIPFDVSADGTRIMVAEKEVGRARLLLAEAGLPNGGSMGYEIFDKDSGFGTTNFVQNINQVRALEGELARTISSLQGVHNARVHIVLPQRELFSREARPSSASVFLGLRGTGGIESSQISAIQSLIASAVPGLKASNVSIIDNKGTLLARGGEEEVNLMTMKTEEMRRNYETNMTSKVEDQVSRIVGYGNVRATVTAEINFDRISTNEELFDPEQQVVRSAQTTTESSTEQGEGGEDVSVENNLPGASGDLLGGGPTNESNRTEEVTNYEIGKTIRSTIREVGEIKKLSVAVLVDGRYKPAEKAAPAEGEEAKEEDKGAKPEMVYEPRSEQEITQITALVKSAVGFNEERGDTIEVVNMQFASVDTDQGEFTDDRMLFGFEKNKLLDVAEIVTVAIMIILVVMLVLQPMVNRLLISEAPEIDNSLEADLLGVRPPSPALTGPSNHEFMAAQGGKDAEESLINMQGVEGKVKASSVKKVEEIVQNYPNETVAVLRSWMTQEPGA